MTGMKRGPLEAYPRIDIYEADRNQGKPCARFLAHEAGWRGDAKVEFSEVCVTIHYSINVGKFYPHGRGVEVFKLTRNSPQDNRPSVKCPQCDRSIQVLVWNGSFACAKCHKLLYASQLGTRDEVELEKRESDLAARIGSGRPKGMQRTTYAKLKADLARLRDQRCQPGRQGRLSYATVRTEWRDQADGWDPHWGAAMSDSEAVAAPSPVKPLRLSFGDLSGGGFTEGGLDPNFRWFQ